MSPSSDPVVPQPCLQLPAILSLNQMSLPLLSLIDSEAKGTEPMHLFIYGNHSEFIWFNLISSPQAPLVLDYPWLTLHICHVDWPSSKVLFWVHTATSAASGLLIPQLAHLLFSHPWSPLTFPRSQPSTKTWGGVQQHLGPFITTSPP